MNECLGRTGNGSCDGGDIGNGTANIINYVVNVEKATITILKELKSNNLLEGVKIAYSNPDDDVYTALYPKGADFDLMQRRSIETFSMLFPVMRSGRPHAAKIVCPLSG
ncbi:MAG: hypothetical protein ACI4XL_11060 [Bacillus sp. (in: firmicutes)]